MSQENVERHRLANDAFNRRDFDALLACVDAEGELRSRNLELEGGGPHRDGIRKWWENLLEVSPDFKGEIEEVRDLGDVTIARVRAGGHGMGSDAPMEETVWQVVEWSHGKATSWRNVASEAEALEAARLREQGA